MVSSVHPTVCFLFLFLLGFYPRKIDYLLNLACNIFASLGPRSVYKDILNNVVSPNDHIVTNHQNQTELIANGAMLAIEAPTAVERRRQRQLTTTDNVVRTGDGGRWLQLVTDGGDGPTYYERCRLLEPAARPARRLLEPRWSLLAMKRRL
jgi:hypothetical protein